MAAPNLKSPTTILATSFGLALTTSDADLIAAIASNHVGLVDSIYICNVDGAVAETVTVTVIKSGPTSFKIANVISVPAGATLVVVSKSDEVNLAEGDKIQAKAGSASKLVAFASWKDIT